MAKRSQSNGPNLFDIIEKEEVKENPASCEHRYELKTETNWPGYPNDPRMTYTCNACGRIRGRCHG